MAVPKKPRAPRAAPRRGSVPSRPGAIAARGERTLTLEGVPYRLRPSREAVSTIEEQTGFSTLELARAGNAGGLTVDQLGIIAAEFIKAGAEDDATRHVGAKQIGDLIYEVGVVNAAPVLTLCLIDAAMGGRTVSGEAKAATA